MPVMNEEEYAKHELKHYGIKRKSGRYPWGSGTNRENSADGRALAFFEAVDALEAQGMTRSEIAKGLGFSSTTELRQAVTIATNAIRGANQDKAEKLREKGWSHKAIGESFDPPRNESYVRTLLDPAAKERQRVLDNTVNALRDDLQTGAYVDVGKGVYNSMGIAETKLSSAVAVLRDEGYELLPYQVQQAGSQNKTASKVLAPPGTTYIDVKTNMANIKLPSQITQDQGLTFEKTFLPPLDISPSRVAVKYAEDGGAAADGVMYVRPGVKDIDLGGSRYAQVRVSVGGTHYLKGMAMYKDDLPPGVDILFNTNKSKDTPMIGDKNNSVLKPQTGDKDNPFGAIPRRQVTEYNLDGTRKVTSAMNLLNEEGSWDLWSRNLSSQVLSKQSPVLAKQLLDKTYEKKKQQLDEINALTNPVVKKHLLEKFADEADSSAVHLSAAGMPRSSYHVILPFNSMKDTEIYAPNFNNGERVALIRYPHGGTFEIPELTVNNNAPVPKAMIGRAVDAVGINAKVAERLSGADFDGDFVMVIPNNSGSIKTAPGLKQLEGFNPQKYKLPDDAPRMSAKSKGKQMGDVSNLITDMTIMKASNEEISRAVRHSMVVIDAEKHHLDYKKSAEDMGIAALKLKYQGAPQAGAATLVSRATSQTEVANRRARRASDGGPIDKATGKRMYEDTGEAYTVTKTMKRTGEVRTTTKTKTFTSVQLAETDDAYTLLSGPNQTGTRIERVYADHSNKLKGLANESRRVMVNTDNKPYSPSAKAVYSKEVAELDARLSNALINAPRERQAQLLTNTLMAQKKADNPEMDNATYKKLQAQALKTSRERMGADKELVQIEDRHWDAIQAGAISSNKLKQILQNTDVDRVRELATPRSQLLMSPGNKAKAQAMAARGATQAEIAATLGVSLTTLKKGLADG